MIELTKEEMDTLGEIANISIGNAATTLSMMVNHRVDITTPTLSIVKRSEVLDDYEKKCVFVQIHYIKGLDGNNVFILKEPDVLVLTDLMMGGSGYALMGGEISELHLSAISEAMNQMMGTSATSMATMLGEAVDISTPDVTSVDVESIKVFERVFDTGAERFVKISFKMDIEGILQSTMVQIYPVSLAGAMCEKFKASELYKG